MADRKRKRQPSRPIIGRRIIHKVNKINDEVGNIDNIHRRLDGRLWRTMYGDENVADEAIPEMQHLWDQILQAIYSARNHYIDIMSMVDVDDGGCMEFEDKGSDSEILEEHVTVKEGEPKNGDGILGGELAIDRDGSDSRVGGGGSVEGNEARQTEIKFIV